MNQKREIKMSEDFDLTGGYTTMSVELLKERFSGWLDHNIDLIGKEPEFHIKEEDRKLIIKVTEEGSRDNENDGSNYYMILQSQGDESEMNEEIETE